MKVPLTQDYFIFSRYFNFSSFKPVVIGRLKVDNYLLSVPYEAPETPEDWKYAVDPKDGKRANKGNLINTSHNGERSALDALMFSDRVPFGAGRISPSNEAGSFELAG